MLFPGFYLLLIGMLLRTSQTFVKHLKSSQKSITSQLFCSSSGQGLGKPENFDILKENGGVPKIPSIDQLAKQNLLRKKIAEAKESPDRDIIEDALDFPCVFTMKIIGTLDSTFVNDVVTAVANALNHNPNSMKYTLKETSGGKYTSITLSPVFQNVGEIRRAYKIVSQDSRVKFVL